MKEDKMKFNIIISIILVTLIIIIIIGVILFLVLSETTESSTSESSTSESSISEISMSESEIKMIANDYEYETEDEQLKKFYNDLLEDGTLIVSEKSASTLDEAKNISLEYKDELNEGISNELNKSSYESYTEFEYNDLIETTYYYKFIGEYTYKYKRSSTIIEEYSKKYAFLVFKSDYFEYPYLKEYSDSYEIKEFGDILAVINYGSEKLIKSEVEDNGEIFTYNLYTILKTYSGPDLGSSNFDIDVITGENYYLRKATFTVNKLTGETNLDIKQGSYQGYMEYKNSYYPCMQSEFIESFSEEK